MEAKNDNERKPNLVKKRKRAKETTFIISRETTLKEVDIQMVLGNATSKPLDPNGYWIKRIDIQLGNKPMNVIIQLSYSKEDPNRIFQQRGPDDFLALSFDLNLKDKEYIKQVLMNGITIITNEKTSKYEFFIYTHNQIKERTCYMCCNNSASMIQSFGDFDKINVVSKRAARIGMLFSSCYSTIEIPTETMMEDIERNGYNFTDGCGLISDDYAKEVALARAITFRGKLFVPSVFQFRWKGCKGVVARDPLSKRMLKIRPSLKKFEAVDNQLSTFCVCDYSKPYSYGHLNKQFIMLLSGLGVPDDVFVERMKEFYEDLEKVVTDHEVAFQYLMKNNNTTLAEKIIKDPHWIKDPTIIKELKLLQAKEVEKIPKLRIMVKKSRNVFGICDQTELLEYGQCFFQPIIDGTPKILEEGYVVVAKNPCYHRGDIRVLSPRKLANCEHLVDTIVFPTLGKRPHPSEIAGSDLDGDMYFVCWDSRLIPPKTVKATLYNAHSSPPKDNITNEDFIDDFVSYDPFLVSRIHKLYNYWADRLGVSCTECVQLSKLFAQAIDSAKTGQDIQVPQTLQAKQCDTPPPETYVWQKLARMANEESAKFKDSKIVNKATEYFDREMVLKSLCKKTDRKVGVSDVELFHFLVAWCRQNPTEKLDEFIDYVDFSRFPLEDMIFAMDNGVPRDIVYNSLNKSEILNRSDLEFFQLQMAEGRWKFYARYQWPRLRYSALYSVLQEVDRKLIILNINGDIAIALFLQDKYKPDKETVIEYKATGFFFGHGFKKKVILTNQKEYRLAFTEEYLQIYRGAKSNSFIKIGSPGGFALSVNNEDEIIVSIDLTTFDREILKRCGKINKSSFQSMEIFVQDSDWTSYEDIFPSGIDYIGEDKEERNSFSLHLLDEEDDEVKETMDDKKADEIVQKAFSNSEVNLTECLQKLTSHRKLKQSKQLYDLIRESNMLTVDDCLCMIECCIAHKKVEDIHEILDSMNENSNLSKEHLLNIIPEVIKSNIQDTKKKDCVSVALDMLVGLKDNSVSLNQFAVLARSCLQTRCHAIDCVNFLHDKLKNIVVAKEGKVMASYFLRMCKLLTEEAYEDVTQLHKGRKDGSAATTLNLSAGPSANSEGHSSNVTFTCSEYLNIPTTLYSIYDPVLLKPQPKMINTLEKYSTIGGRVVGIDNNFITVQITEGDLPPNMEAFHWRIDKDYNETTYKRMLEALEVLCDTGSKCTNLFDIIYALESKDFATVTKLANEKVLHLSHEHKANMDQPINNFTSQNHVVPMDNNNNSNQSQGIAIQQAFDSRLSLIQGPPGTGKTFTLALLLQQWVEERKQGNTNVRLILASAETNIAVDNIMIQLRKIHLSCVRIGVMARIDLSLQQFSLSHQYKQELKKHSRNEARSLPKFLDDIIYKVDVVCCTLATLGDRILKKYKFTHIALDEVSQSIEPSTLMAFVKGAQQAALFGDHKQLAPTVKSKSAEELKNSLFQRLINQTNLNHTLLNVQYRMHPMISEFPSKKFYDGKLLNDVKASQCPKGFPSVSFPVEFLDVRGSQQRRAQSFQNEIEARKVVTVIQDMLKGGEVGGADIGVISGYSAQVSLIKELLQSKSLPKITVKTVDGFQGREKEIIIFSAVRCDGQLGFLNDEKRLNVMLTRAKRGLVIIGHKDTLQLDSSWKEWLAWIESKKTFSSNQPPLHREKQKKPNSRENRQPSYRSNQQNKQSNNNNRSKDRTKHQN